MTKLVLYTENYFHGGLERFIFDIILNNKFDLHIVVNSENERVINMAKKYMVNYTVVELCNYKLVMKVNYKYNKFVKLINFGIHYLSMIPNYFIIKKGLSLLYFYRNIMIVNGGYPAALSCFSASIAAKKLGFTKVGLSVLSSPSPNYTNSIFRFFQSKIDNFFNHYIDFYIPNSNDIQSNLINIININEKKIQTVYTGINIPSIIEKTNTLSYAGNIVRKNDDEVWIGMLALLGSTKRQDLLIEALSKVDCNIKLMLVGDGPNMDFLIEKVNSMNLNDRVIFTGWVSNVEEVYSFIDILVFLSDQEGLPYSISEAMSYKVPIISSAVGGIKEQIIDKKGGFLIDNNDVDALVNKINFLASHSELQEKFIKYSFKRVEKMFSIRSMNNAILKLYE